MCLSILQFMDIWVISGPHKYRYCFYEKSYTRLSVQKQAFFQGLCLGVGFLCFYALSAVYKTRSFQMFSFLLIQGYEMVFHCDGFLFAIIWLLVRLIIFILLDHFRFFCDVSVYLLSIFLLILWEELIIFSKYFLWQEHVL